MGLPSLSHTLIRIQHFPTREHLLRRLFRSLVRFWVALTLEALVRLVNFTHDLN